MTAEGVAIEAKGLSGGNCGLTGGEFWLGQFGGRRHANQHDVGICHHRPNLFQPNLVKGLRLAFAQHIFDLVTLTLEFSGQEFKGQ